MKHLITALVAVVCVVLGGVFGHMLRGGGESASAASSIEAEAAAGEEGNAAAKEGAHASGKAKASGNSGSASGSAAAAYFRFSREFVVPVIERERVVSLVILNINIEVDSASSSKLFSEEPVLRDVVMTTLIEISGDGRTFQSMTSIENYETIRSMILAALQKKYPSMGIRNVLILDMARQDI